MGTSERKRNNTRTVPINPHNLLTFNKEENNKVGTNPEIVMIQRELEVLYKKGRLNELNLYLYGIVLRE